ncbi:MAG TPA: Lrp/AsnC family transcriptional regulator, partial [Pseudomonas sp.]|nr:Lrp/AsnC family transcriptional regulator [Pseudomonas sp.]
MDKYDRMLLSALLENGRASYADLARKVNLSAPAVAERVAKLETSGVITGYQ